MTDDTELLQRFVDCFARLDDSTFTHDEPPPPELTVGLDPDDWNVIRWRPVATETSADALHVFANIGSLPTLYQQLILSHRWLAVDLHLFRLLGNPPATDLQPLSNLMFSDPVLTQTLVPKGYIRFGLAPNSSYDPICFDLNRFDSDDCPIVRLEHESILMHDTIGDVTTLFDTFRDLVFAVVAVDTHS